MKEQQKGLASKLRGHYEYFGITGNFLALKRLFYEVKRMWREWLSTRSRDGQFTWQCMEALLERLPLPAPRIVHRSVM